LEGVNGSWGGSKKVYEVGIPKGEGEWELPTQRGKKRIWKGGVK